MTCVSEDPYFLAAVPRFEAKYSVVPSGCWEWRGFVSRNGYGRLWFKGQMEGAHRVAHILFIGEIPKGYDIDHLCRNRCCVNPDHLEAVTRRENLLRGDTIPAKWAARWVEA